MKHIFVAFRDFTGASKERKTKIILKTLAYLGGALLLFVFAIFAYFAKDLPSPSGFNGRFVAESTKIYDRTGTHLLYDIHGEEKRTLIDFNQIPESMKFATISLEDQNFYSNHGIELTSIIRAGLSDIFHMQASQGGSTITQQLIKQTVLSPEKTFSRKIKEAILSIELGQRFSKDQILGMYLNQIPYGSNAYGVEAASQTFFGKHASELTLDESALLAALPQAPSYYSPYGNHTDALRGRQVYALNQMAKLGYITQEQADAAKQTDVLAKVRPFSDNISAPHFVMYIKDYLEKKYGAQMLEQGGLKVYTTLDWDKQQLAEQAVKEGADLNTKKYGASNAAFIAMDPKTGQILAMVGSKDYFDKSIDGQVNVTIANRQPGSSFKPYVYLTAFEKGYTPETQIWDVDTNFSTDSGKDYNPKNYDGKNHGLLHMKDTLAMSLNVPAVETLYLADVKSSIDTAHALGITTLNNPDQYGLSLVLGGGEVTLLDHVNAYASLAADGIYHPKTAILKITSASGDTLEEYKDTPGQKVVDEKYIGMLDYIMSTNSLRAPVFGNNSPLAFNDRPVAAKTGTTNEWRDGWTVGYTPSIVAGVWAGNNDNSPMAAGADGVFTAAPIWRKFMDAVLKNYSTEQFPKYEPEDAGKPILNGDLDPTTKLDVCKISKDNYCLANDTCPKSTTDKKEFASAHSILYYVNKDDPRGDPPKHPEDDPQFDNWEKAVQKYIEKNKDFKGSSDPAPTEDCKASDFKDSGPSVSISSPKDGVTITSPAISIKGKVSADYGIQSITLYVDGSEVESSDKSSFNFSYDVPSDKKSTNLDIKVTATDDADNSDSDSITIHTNIL